MSSFDLTPSSNVKQGAPKTLRPGEIGPKPEIWRPPNQEQPQAQILRPGGVIGPKPNLDPSSSPIKNRELYFAAEEFGRRLITSGSLVREIIRADRVLARYVKRSNHRTDPLAPTPGSEARDSSRYIGCDPDGNPAKKAALHCGQMTAVNREMWRYVSQAVGKIVPQGDTLRVLPQQALAGGTLYTFRAARDLCLPNIDRTLQANRGDSTLRQIEREFGIDALRAIRDPLNYSFTRGLGRSIAASCPGLIHQTVRRFPGEPDNDLQNVVFFGEGGVRLPFLLPDTVTQFSFPEGKVLRSPGLIATTRR